MGLIVKHWAGWLSSDTMLTNKFAWFNKLVTHVQDAESTGYEPNVFRIKKGDRDAIADIERYLQSRYNTGS